MTQLEGFARRGFDRILEERGITDDVLLEKLIAFGWEVRQFQANAPAEAPKWMHPAIQMIKRISGKRVPAVNIDDVIALVGESPDEAEYMRAFKDWAGKGKDAADLTWLKWARPNQKPKVRAVADPFAAFNSAGLGD